MFDDEFKSKLKDFFQNELNEIQENKLRFAAVFICFVIAAILLFTDENSGGDNINVAENTAPIETPAPVENVDTNKKIIAVNNAATSNADKNITAVIGANSDNLYVSDPFKVPPKPKVEPPPEIPAVITPPPVAQVLPAPTEKFILRGTAIIGNKKSALLQKITPNEKNSDDENLILEIGDSLNGKKIIDIDNDSLTFDDGLKIFLDTN